VCTNREPGDDGADVDEGDDPDVVIDAAARKPARRCHNHLGL